MSEYEFCDIVINSFIAVSTIGAVFVALFGQKINDRLSRPKLSIEILDINGDLTTLTSGTRSIYYHLRFINKKPSIVIRNCRANLKKILKLNSDNKFEDLPLAVPPSYCWAPRISLLKKNDIYSEQVLDFGSLKENDKYFMPEVEPIFNNFKGFLLQNQTFRYQLEVVADNYRSNDLLTIEVSWNGRWTDDVNKMKDNLIIKMI